MTTLVATRKGNKAVIAADTLTTYGSSLESADYVSTASKIGRFSRTYIAATGPAATAYALRSFMARYQALERIDRYRPDEWFIFASKFFTDMRERFCLIEGHTSDDPFGSMDSELLICSPVGIFGVYSDRSVQEYTRFAAFGSGSEYAMGAMYATFDRVMDPADVAVVGLRAACEFDAGTAYPTELHAVDLVATAGLEVG